MTCICLLQVQIHGQIRETLRRNGHSLHHLQVVLGWTLHSIKLKVVQTIIEKIRASHSQSHLLRKMSQCYRYSNVINLSIKFKLESIQTAVRHIMSKRHFSIHGNLRREISHFLGLSTLQYCTVSVGYGQNLHNTKEQHPKRYRIAPIFRKMPPIAVFSSQDVNLYSI